MRSDTPACISDRDRVASELNAWFVREARDLPWRAPGTSAWAVLVSEFMLQQTQVERVIPRWIAWLERWPTPAALAANEPGEAVRAWDRLGYPRRALWLHRAATEIVGLHGGEVPRDVDALLALTGVGPYTARAIAAFAYGERHPVVDTNTRRVLARLVHGVALAGMPKDSDLEDMEALLPEDRASAAVFNAAAMELGAIVCTARTPRCGFCPVAQWCEWRGSGYPANAPTKRPRQAAFEGSDRQARGRIMALLRRSSDAVSREAALAAAAGDEGHGKARRRSAQDPTQPQRAFDSLIADGLIVEFEGRVKLP
ncbi:A/G-specific adenine glycosylase [Leucobacter insecticola]|uniref:Adenine DNA glycosylase n=1 Tax=Leucobacter insecticola TaxID=2714934 RepID=A0A6G8FHT2_9MICO|nr:A/G-specific adenine glycosylase [Leucobacter insecticola]QIM15925.1 A/G-specific adenine glycosylase [Leucobacter insecticola]